MGMGLDWDETRAGDGIIPYRGRDTCHPLAAISSVLSPWLLNIFSPLCSYLYTLVFLSIPPVVLFLDSPTKVRAAPSLAMCTDWNPNRYRHRDPKSGEIRSKTCTHGQRIIPYIYIPLYSSQPSSLPSFPRHFPGQQLVTLSDDLKLCHLLPHFGDDMPVRGVSRSAALTVLVNPVIILPWALCPCLAPALRSDEKAPNKIVCRFRVPRAAGHHFSL
jgi:hypothetical protein